MATGGEEEEEGRRDLGRSSLEERLRCEHILPRPEEQCEEEEQCVEERCEEVRRAKEHTYQAYMKIQDISPVLSNRVNLKDLQESIDILIGNLERELNKNKLNVGY